MTNISKNNAIEVAVIVNCGINNIRGIKLWNILGNLDSSSINNLSLFLILI